ncbi:restriction endonuclease subunit S [Mycolicibacterium wolinskyi]|uniref:restriction endonuclease subunit S n=1 Tax=Mycolicibacterium wolinskyi TaxID=59750 RepID=UPI00391795A4
MTKLGELVNMTFGNAFKSSEFTDTASDIRLLRGDNIGQGRLRWDGAKRFPAHRIAEVERYQLEEGDVVIAMDRPWITAGLKYSVVRGRDLPCLLVQRVARLRSKAGLDQGYLGAIVGSKAFTDYVIGVQTGSAVPHISGGQIADFELPPLPPIEVQRAIAGILGTLDDKIESNHRQRDLLRKLGAARFVNAVTYGGVERPLGSVTMSIARGVAPRYADDDEFSAPLVLNQRCIRDGWVSLAPARRAQDRVVAPAKKASSGDILVNSTGVGTLGRVARWHEGSIFVDSHVSVIKPDVTEVGPTVLAYAMLARVPDIEALGEGSTGQTELSPARLGEFKVLLPDASKMGVLEDELFGIERCSEQLANENVRLASVRDALAPELLSGRIRVPTEEVA